MNNTWRHINVAEIMTKSIQHISDEKWFDIFFWKCDVNFIFYKNLIIKIFFCYNFPLKWKTWKLLNWNLTPVYISTLKMHKTPRICNLRMFICLLWLLFHVLFASMPNCVCNLPSFHSSRYYSHFHVFYGS